MVQVSEKVKEFLSFDETQAAKYDFCLEKGGELTVKRQWAWHGFHRLWRWLFSSSYSFKKIVDVLETNELTFAADIDRTKLYERLSVKQEGYFTRGKPKLEKEKVEAVFKKVLPPPAPPEEQPISPVFKEGQAAEDRETMLPPPFVGKGKTRYPRSVQVIKDKVVAGVKAKLKSPLKNKDAPSQSLVVSPKTTSQPVHKALPTAPMSLEQTVVPSAPQPLVRSRSGSLVAKETKMIAREERIEQAVGSDTTAGAVTRPSRSGSLSGMPAETIAQLAVMGDKSTVIGVPKTIAAEVVAAKKVIPTGTATVQKTRQSLGEQVAVENDMLSPQSKNKRDRVLMPPPQPPKSRQAQGGSHKPAETIVPDPALSSGRPRSNSIPAQEVVSETVVADAPQSLVRSRSGSIPAQKVVSETVVAADSSQPLVRSQSGSLIAQELQQDTTTEKVTTRARRSSISEMEISPDVQQLLGELDPRMRQNVLKRMKAETSAQESIPADEKVVTRTRSNSFSAGDKKPTGFSVFSFLRTKKEEVVEETTMAP